MNILSRASCFRPAPSTLTALVAAIFAAFASAPAAAQESLAIKGGRIIPIQGDVIDGGVILIENGKIKAVGKDLAIPIEAKVIDATGKTVMPGFVEAHSSSAMSQANEQNPNVPYLSVVDSIDPSRTYFEDARRNGVTSVAVTPGNSTMIGGQSAVIKTAGGFVDSMILKRNAGIKISLRPSSSSVSRMSHLAKLRKEFDDAKKAMADEEEQTAKEKKAQEEKAKKEAEKKDDAKDGEKKDETGTVGDSKLSRKTPTAADQQMQLEAMKKLLNGELQAVIYCDTAMDVLQAAKLTKDYGLKSIMVLGRDCYKAADHLAKLDATVVLGEDLVFWRTDPRTGDDEKIVLPKIYQDKKVPYVFQASTSSSSLGSRYLWYQAAIAVKYGLSEDEALEALTLRPAKLLGVDEFVGSIEPGKDADLVVLSGDPLKVSTWVEMTIVNGDVVYEKDKDEKLKSLLQLK